VNPDSKNRRAVALVASLPLAAMMCVVACRNDTVGTESAPVSGPRTVVLVTIDTWRRDASGFLGDREPSPTPFLDDWAGSGFVPTDAIAPVPLTGPSHWSMLTGRWPWRDGVRVNGDRPDPDRGPGLAQLLSERGWTTAAFVSCAVLDHRYGFAAGFRHYDDDFQAGGRITDIEMPERRGDRTVDRALGWLGSLDPSDSLFLWVHLFDPHFPYSPPTGPGSGTHGDYLAEVAFADRQVQRLSAALDGLGRPSAETMWVVLSDHGEGLGEHGERSHGLLLHGATTRIPMLIRGPGIPARRYPGLVSTVDVLPTITGYLGFVSPAGDGVDLLRASRSPDRAIPLESLMGAHGFGLAPAYGLRLEEWLWESSPEDHLWNLIDDPAEEIDLAASRPEAVRSMRDLRETFELPETTVRAHDRETLGRLRALGYVGSGSTAGEGDVRLFSSDGAEWHFQILTLQRQGKFADAETFVRRFLDRYPRSVSILVEGGFVAVGLGDMATAEERFRRAVELQPRHTQARLNLANVLLHGQQTDEAEAEYRRVLAEDPEDLFALYNLGNLLVGTGRHTEARPHWERFVDLYPRHPKADEVRTSLSSMP
jgi:arylsulfatase A-like enzyme/TolA-binding protein